MKNMDAWKFKIGFRVYKEITDVEASRYNLNPVEATYEFRDHEFVDPTELVVVEEATVDDFALWPRDC